jgi:asparagine synthase (glutamine-hydrolysing)
VSAIAGIVYWDGRPVPESTAQRMSLALERFGPDAAGVFREGNVALVQRALWTTPEQETERQPLLDRASGLVLALDGRLDNRDELMADLAVRDTPATDADLVLQSWLAWGPGGLSRLIGDFAFAIWDPRAQRLVCVRDALGVRRLSYYDGGRFLAFATDGAALFAIPEVEKRPNPDTIARQLAVQWSDGSSSPFAHIHRLWNAHWLEARQKDVQVRRYWDLDSARICHWSKPQQYEEALLDAMRTAMRARSRTRGPVGTILSGGLDSSSVFATGAGMTGCGGPADLRGYAVAFPGAPYDERSFVISLAAATGRPVRYLCPEIPVPLWGIGEARRSDEHPLLLPMAFMIQQPIAAAAAEGVRVLWSGLGGDEFLDGSLAGPAHLLLTGQARTAWSMLRDQARFQGMPLREVLRLAIVPLLLAKIPAGLRRSYRRLRPRSVPPWLRPAYARRVADTPDRPPWPYPAGGLAEKEAAWRTVNSGGRVVAHEQWERLAAAGPVEIRHPLADRRLVELVTSFPIGVLTPQGVSKGLLRSTMSGILPEVIRQRPSKAEFSELIISRTCSTDRPEALRLLSHSVLQDLGIIDARLAARYFQSYAADYRRHLTDYRSFDRITMLLHVEAWAQNVWGAGPAAP